MPKRIRGLGASRAEQAGEADDFALGNSHAHRADAAGAADRLRIDERFARGRLLLRRGVMDSVILLDFAPKHFADEFDPRQLGSLELADECTVPEHREAVTDRVDLIEEARDEQDRQPASRSLRSTVKSAATSCSSSEEVGSSSTSSSHFTSSARDGDHLPDRVEHERSSRDTSRSPEARDRCRACCGPRAIE